MSSPAERWEEDDKVILQFACAALQCIVRLHSEGFEPKGTLAPKMAEWSMDIAEAMFAEWTKRKWERRRR